MALKHGEHTLSDNFQSIKHGANNPKLIMHKYNRIVWELPLLVTFRALYNGTVVDTTTSSNYNYGDYVNAADGYDPEYLHTVGYDYTNGSYDDEFIEVTDNLTLDMVYETRTVNKYLVTIQKINPSTFTDDIDFYYDGIHYSISGSGFYAEYGGTVTATATPNSYTGTYTSNISAPTLYAINGNQIRITNPNSFACKVYYGTSSSSVTSGGYDISANGGTYTLTGLSANTTYYVRLYSASYGEIAPKYTYGTPTITGNGVVLGDKTLTITGSTSSTLNGSMYRAGYSTNASISTLASAYNVTYKAVYNGSVIISSVVSTASGTTVNAINTYGTTLSRPDYNYSGGTSDGNKEVRSNITVTTTYTTRSSLKSYTVTISATNTSYMTYTVYADGVAISSGASVPYGANITATATPKTYNGTQVSNISAPTLTVLSSSQISVTNPNSFACTVYRGTSTNPTGGGYSVSANSTYTLTSLSANTTYYVRLYSASYGKKTPVYTYGTPTISGTGTVTGNKTVTITGNSSSSVTSYTYAAGYSTNVSAKTQAGATTYTLTLSKDTSAYGSWNKSSITGIASGTTVSYSIASNGKATLTVGSQTAVFTPTYIDEFNNYVTDYLTNASGSVTSNKTVKAYTKVNPNISIWDVGIFIDGENTSDTASIGSFTKARIYYTYFTYDFNTQEEYDVIVDYVDLYNYDTYNTYCDDEEQNGYGVLGVNISANTQDIDFNVAIATTGDNGITIFEAYEIRSI